MKYLILILRILLAITFLFSAYTKAVAPGYFEITLMDQGLAHDRNFAANMTRFFIGLEFAMGVFMIFPFFIKKLMVFTFFLLSAFTIHLIYLTIIGDNENCGCFGEMISPKDCELGTHLLHDSCPDEFVHWHPLDQTNLIQAYIDGGRDKEQGFDLSIPHNHIKMAKYIQTVYLFAEKCWNTVPTYVFQG